ncbi:amino acid permease [Escherichia coli]|nr:amino acid permease [Escherichia coli]
MEKKLGLSALTALVLSSMLGAGVFSLPQNMAAVASPAALLIGWGITGAGILLLAFAMLILTRIRPELDGGIFTYAREGFGELIGFCSAWGYWLCAVIANVYPSSQPMAELWMGAHPKSSSRVQNAAGDIVSLRDVIESDKSTLLGEAVAKRFGELPFLFKVLCAAQPLSIQVHPNRCLSGCVRTGRIC